MKTRITRNELKKNFDLIIKVPYCKLQYVLDGQDAVYYNDGLYGWNYDVYTFKLGIYTVAICTGCRPIGKKCFNSDDYLIIEAIAKYNKIEGQRAFRRVLHNCVVNRGICKYGVKGYLEMLYS